MIRCYDLGLKKKLIYNLFSFFLTGIVILASSPLILETEDVCSNPARISVIRYISCYMSYLKQNAAVRAYVSAINVREISENIQCVPNTYRSCDNTE